MRVVIFLFIIYFSIVDCNNATNVIHLNKTSNPVIESVKFGATEGENVHLSSRLALPHSSVPPTAKDSVKPRKGADYNLSKEETTSNATGTDPVRSVINDSINPNTETLHNQNVTAATFSISKINISSSDKTPANEANDTVTHKKPLILSYEALANASRTEQDSDQITRTDSFSPKTTISDQVRSPIESKLASEKIHPMQSGRHPDMIMPVVITILVVPMFAVLGYMVLRRGREAWKNRHYKRMDFLLDGMYND